MKRLFIFILLVTTYSSFSQTEELKGLSLKLDIQNQDTSKVSTSIKIIKLLYNSKDYLNALKFAKESETLSKSLNYKEGVAQINHIKGLIYFEKKDLTKALKYFKTSKLLYYDLESTTNIARVNSDMAILEIINGNNTLGTKYAIAAIEEFKNKENYKELFEVYDKLINTYETVNINEKAIVFCMKKLEIIKSLNDTNRLINGNKKLALLYDKEGNYPKAINYLDSALSYGKNNKNLQRSLFPIIGGIHLKRSAYKTATNYLKEGLKLNRSANNVDGIILSLSHLGEINLIHKRFETAEKQFLEIDQLARKVNNYTALINNYKQLIALDSTKGHFENAFKKQQEYYTLLNKISLSELSHKNEAINKKNNSGASNNELLIAKVSQDATVVSKNKFDKFRKNMYLAIGGFLILAICLVIAYFKRNKGIKYTKDLEQKNKNIELQKEAILEENKHFEDINNTKDKLFSIVSHDLKDSLTSTKGLIDLLKEKSITKEEFDSLIPELSDTANNAYLLLYNLLNWSKSQMKSLEAKPIFFDIQDVFKEKLKLVEQKLKTKRITLVNKTHSSIAYADRSMVEIVVQNIITNAIKFCDPLDKITITNNAKNNHMLISIADTGIGISKENISKLFGGDKTFTTIGTQNEKGTGLGLSICKDLISLNNGRIWVESTLGIGSTFYIELPVNEGKNTYNEVSSNASVEILQPSYSEHSLLHRLQ